MGRFSKLWAQYKELSFRFGALEGLALRTSASVTPASSPPSLPIASSCTSPILSSAVLFQMAINRSTLYSVGGRDEGGNVRKEEVTGRAVCREQPEGGGGPQPVLGKV